MQPDILLILTDQWNPRLLGYAGNTRVRTPNLDALAAEGAFFTAAYTQSPVCMPARCSLATGLYPHNHGYWNNFTGRRLAPELVTLFRDLQTAGYTTAKIGKYHFFNLEWGEDHREFADYYAALGLDWAQELPTPYMGPYLRNEYTEHLHRLGLFDAYAEDIARRFQDGDFEVVAPSPLPPDAHIDGYVAGQATKYLEAAPTDRPLFLCVSFPGPHTPFDAPHPYADRYRAEEMELAPNVPERFPRQGRTLPDQSPDFDRDHVRRAQANYFGKQTHLDDRVGQIVDALRRRGTWDRTLVMFSADHGEYMGSHGRFGKGGFEEESARIPLILRWPGEIAPGQQISALAQWIDLHATALDAAGATASTPRFGRSLLPLVRGEQAAIHDAVFSEIARQDQPCYMVRTPRYKWFTYGEREFLYDLASDPYEQTNLAGEAARRETQGELRERLRHFLMTTQLNHAAGYLNLFTRMGLNQGPPEQLADRLLARIRTLHAGLSRTDNG